MGATDSTTPASSDADSSDAVELPAAGTIGYEFNYAHKKCEQCIPGTYRPLNGSIAEFGTPNVLHDGTVDDVTRLCVDW